MAWKLQGRWARQMSKLIVFLLVILPLITVMATKDPKGAGQLAQGIVMAGAWLLETTAKLLVDIGHIFGGK